VADRGLVDILRRKYAHSVTISAAKHIGLEKLSALVTERLADGFAELEIEASAGNGRLLAFLAEHATVDSRVYVDSTVTLRCRIPRQFVHHLAQHGVVIRERNGNLNVQFGSANERLRLDLQTSGPLLMRELQRNTTGAFVFETERGGPFTADAVNRLVKTIGARAKLPFGVHAHMLRHACGYAMANAGHDTRLIQDWLGHRAIQHTARYTELSPTRFKDVWR